MTDWWNKNVPNRIDDFKSWVGDYNKRDKIYCRDYVAKKQYKSILDCGCGVATEYHGYKSDKYNIDYTGLDSCEFFIEYNEKQNIPMIRSDLDVELPVRSDSFDCVYCREVLEHLSHYETALTNFIRIAKKEVIIGWFIKPGESEELIDYWETEDLYHNKYNKNKIETFLKANPKVKEIKWKDADAKNSIMHIILEQK